MYFYHHNNYFTPDSSEFPLLHTWSLSVEEQYYIFWPLVLLLFFRFSKSFRWLKPFGILLLFIFSYGFSIYCIKHNGSLGYYSIFSRTFELMVGSILALIISADSEYIKNIKYLAVKLIFANFASALGLILIIYSSYCLTDKDPFPGYIALIPTLGAGLIIYAGHLSHRSVINRILSSRVFVAVGLLSYSLYLWHWPLLAFWHYYNPGISVPLHTGVWMLCITFILSLVSYFLIELPIKHKRYKFKEALLKFYLLPLGATIIISSIIIKTDGLPMRVSTLTLNETQWIDEEKYCFVQETGKCNLNQVNGKDTPRVILIGDSHAAALSPFWNYISESLDFKMNFKSNASCPPLLNTNLQPVNLEWMDSEFYQACKNQINSITNNYKKYDLFILIGDWNKYYTTPANQQIDFNSELNNTLKFLTQHGTKVIIMGGTPSYKSIVMVRQRMLPKFADSNMQAIQTDNLKYNKNIKHIANLYPNVYYFDTESDLVTPIKMFPSLNGFVLLIDNNHLSQMGSILLAKEYMASKYSQQLQQLLKSWVIINESKAK